MYRLFVTKSVTDKRLKITGCEEETDGSIIIASVSVPNVFPSIKTETGLKEDSDSLRKDSV